MLLFLVANLDASRHGWGSDQIAALKFLPVVFFVLWFISVSYLTKSLPPPLLLYLVFFPFVFSLYLVVFEGAQVENTYLSRSISLFFLIIGYYLYRISLTDRRILARLNQRIAPFSFLMLIVCFLFPFGLYPLGVNDNGPELQVYHTTIYIPAAASFLIAFSNGAVGKVVFYAFSCFVILVVLFTGKATSAIVSVVLFVLVVFSQRISQSNFSIVTLLKFFAFFLTILFFVVLYFVIVNRAGEIGENSVRLRAFEILLDEFISSPFYGEWFLGSPKIEFTSNFEAPSHLDFLDLLSAGGLLWFVPFCYVLTLAIRASVRRLAAFSSESPWVFFLIAGFFTIFFNPALSDPRASFLFLISLGFFYGSARKNSLD